MRYTLLLAAAAIVAVLHAGNGSPLQGTEEELARELLVELRKLDDLKKRQEEATVASVTTAAPPSRLERLRTKLEGKMAELSGKIQDAVDTGRSGLADRLQRLRARTECMLGKVLEALSDPSITLALSDLMACTAPPTEAPAPVVEARGERTQLIRELSRLLRQYGGSVETSGEVTGQPTAAGSVEVTGGGLGSSEVTGGPLGSSEVTGGPLESSEVTGGAAGSSEVTGGVPGSSEVTGGVPGSFEVTGAPGGSAEATGAAGASAEATATEDPLAALEALNNAEAQAVGETGPSDPADPLVQAAQSLKDKLADRLSNGLGNARRRRLDRAESRLLDALQTLRDMADPVAAAEIDLVIDEVQGIFEQLQNRVGSQGSAERK